MAVKASIQITISKVIDVYAVYRYYKLQSSTLAKPSKPTTNPPSGWSDTEPAYVSGSTNTLYFVDCNVYSDKTFSFSEVSKSSSYEAAKDAWNKANAAFENTVVSVDIEYYLSTSATSLAGGSWTTKAPTWVDGKYMWSRTVTVDGAGNKTYSPNQNGVCIAGAKGNNGKDAAVISSTEPSDKTYLWCDTSVSPPVLKQWNGEEWIVVNDNAEQITQIYKEITNSITQSSENIMMQVGEKTYSKEAVDRLLSDMNTSFEQTKNSFNFEFNRFQTALNDLSNSTDTKFENTSKYIRFVDGEIYIGVEGNPIMLRLRNDRLSFLENNAEVAYISNRTLYFTHAEVLKDLKIGRFAWVAMDSGYMALKLVE